MHQMLFVLNSRDCVFAVAVQGQVQGRHFTDEKVRLSLPVQICAHDKWGLIKASGFPTLPSLSGYSLLNRVPEKPEKKQT